MFLDLRTRLGVAIPAASPAASRRGHAGPVARGEIGVLIGPSGCGKTSLLRAVAGLERLCRRQHPHGRRLLADDATGQHLEPEARRIGMVFQDYALFPHLSVRDNVAFGIRHLPAPSATPAWPRCWNWSAWAMPRKRAPHQLSGGQQQRVALARALAPGPTAAAGRALLQPRRRPARAAGPRTARHPASTPAPRRCSSRTTSSRPSRWATCIGVMNRGRLRAVGRCLRPVPPPGHALRRRFHRPRRVHAGTDRGAASGRRPSSCDPAGRPLADAAECPLPGAYPDGQCDVLLRADDIVHDDEAPVRARIERKAFRGSEFLYTLRLASGERCWPTCPPPRPPCRRMDRHPRRGGPRGDLRAGGRGLNAVSALRGSPPPRELSRNSFPSGATRSY
jgi:iron(III) transport system ATP-binding protein